MADRVAIVTGGLRGLGRDMTLGLAASGVRVLAVGHLPEDVAAMEGTPDVRAIVADLRSPAACDRVVSEALSAFGRLDILVNNAGLRTPPGMNQEMRDWSREGRAPRLVEPDEMVPPLLYVVSTAADKVNGYRFDALTWDVSLPPVDAARRNGRPAGFVLHPQDEAAFPAG